ncbi:MAG: restriction endonuclease [Bacilli bacterium]
MTLQRDRLNALIEALPELTDGQRLLIEDVVRAFQQPAQFWLNPKSDFVDECVLSNFGDSLRIHHCFSNESFTKDKFEYALERVARLCGLNAERPGRNNPGHDITINGVPVSLKTQADKNIKSGEIHISKFMELGKGAWNLEELTQRFLKHMGKYDRIFTLRNIQKGSVRFSVAGKKEEVKAIPSNWWTYELVEIPKPLLQEVTQGTYEIDENSTQTPKPGYCHVFGDHEDKKFSLYFDGGTERKLQVRYLQKSWCIVHATWAFPNVH